MPYLDYAKFVFHLKENVSTYVHIYLFAYNKYFRIYLFKLDLFIALWLYLGAYMLQINCILCVFPAQTASVYLTVAVTIERYIAVCHSLQAR